jgi:hypothetical protein
MKANGDRMNGPIDRRALSMTTNPPFPYDRNDISKYTLVEIAVEFIMWDSAGPFVTGESWPDTDRCRWIMLAIEYNFPHDQWEAKFKHFPAAYKKALVIEPSDQADSLVNIRELVRKRPLRDWPSKAEYYHWPKDDPA